jgi:hypothetical protein
MESYPLLCIDVADSTLKWSVKVPLLTVAWSGPPIGMIHANEFRLAEDTIYVIGATAFSLYIEGYSVVTGTMTARFRTE